MANKIELSIPAGKLFIVLALKKLFKIGDSRRRMVPIELVWWPEFQYILLL